MGAGHSLISKVGKGISAEDAIKALDASGDIVEGAGKVISEADSLKLSKWKYAPNDELYLKFKKVFDNPKYYDQLTGDIKWPINDGFDGVASNMKLKQGTRIDRYGFESSTFVSPECIPFEMRSLALGTITKPYHVYEVVKR